MGLRVRSFLRVLGPNCNLNVTLANQVKDAAWIALLYDRIAGVELELLESPRKPGHLPLVESSLEEIDS